MVKIAGVVIAYYPDLSKLIYNIDTYIDQIEEFFIVFNSPVNSLEVNALESKYPKVQLILNNKNLGIATPLNKIAFKTLNLGYEWLLTMDQDSYFQTDAFFEAFEKRNSKNVAIFSPNPFSPLNIEIEIPDVYEEILNIITSGNLLNLNIWKTIGGFEEKLFIDEVDNDYCLKAVSNGYKIIFFKNIPLIHELGANREVSFLFKNYNLISHSPIRAYYIFRNNFYMFSKYKKVFPEFVKSRRIMLFKVFVKILFFSTERIRNCHYIIHGIKDYFHNSYGPYKDLIKKSIRE